MKVADEIAFECARAALEIEAFEPAAEFARRCFPGKRFPLLRLLWEVSRRDKRDDFRVHFYE